MRERLRGQCGQTAAEYLGALLILSVIVAAVANTHVGQRITREMQRLVCEIAGGGDCDALVEDEAALPEPSDCVVAEATSKLTVNGEFSVRVYKVRLEGGVEYTRQKRANGKVAMSFKLGTSGGVGAMLKKYVDGTLKLGPNSTATFVLPDDAAANRFAQQIKDSAKAIAMSPVTRYTGGPEPHIDWPPLESVSFEYTGGVSATSEVEDISGYAEGGLEGAEAIGAKLDVTKGEKDSGDRTVYFKVNARAGASVGLPLLEEGYTGTLAGELTLAITYDRDNHAKRLSLTGVGNWEHGEQDRLPLDDRVLALRHIDALDVKSNERTGGKSEFQIDLALTDQAERELALALVTGVGPASGLAMRVNAGRRLWKLVQEKGKIQLRHYATDATTDRVGVDLEVASGGIAYDTTSAELTSAKDYEAGRGFLPSLVCR
jgi:hypothetical protein